MGNRSAGEASVPHLRSTGAGPAEAVRLRRAVSGVSGARILASNDGVSLSGSVALPQGQEAAVATPSTPARHGRLRYPAVFLAASMIAVLIAVMPGSVMAEDEPPWRRKEAKARLRVEVTAPSRNMLRIDLPLECRKNVQGVYAFVPEIGTVPASPIFIDQEMVAVECLMPRSGKSGRRWRSEREDAASRLSLEIYLLTDAEVPYPCPEQKRTPVHVQRTVRRLTTRPFTAAEITRLTGTLRQRQMSADIAGFDLGTAPERWQTPGERQTAISHFSSELFMAEPGDLWFGAGQQATAWFLFLDGEPIVDWRSGRLLGQEGRRSGKHTLARGFHRLDLFVVQSADESVPELLVRTEGTDFAPIPSSRLFPAARPAALLLERQDGVLQAGMDISDVQRYLFPEVGTDLLTFRLSELATQTFGRKVVGRSLRLHGADTVFEPGAVLAVAGKAVPDIELAVIDEHNFRSQISLPGYFTWLDPVLVSARLHVHSVPGIISSSEPLEFDYLLDMPEKTAEGLEAYLTVRLAQKNSAGETLDVRELGAPKPNVWQPVEILLDRSTAAVEVTCVVEQRPVCPPAIVSVRRPSDRFDGLSVRGRGLYVEQTPVVLCCDPLRPFVNRSAEKGQVPRTQQAPLTIVDDFWAVGAGLDAAVMPEEWLRQAGAENVRRYRVRCPLQGSARELRKFSLLDRALDREGGVVLWAVGANELRVGFHAEDICMHLLFLAQATHAAGAVPVFMTLPQMPEVPEMELRRTALLTKELAYRLKVPVVDAYSLSKKEVDWDGGFEGSFRSTVGTLALAGPNDRGRVWLCRLVEQTLRTVPRTRVCFSR